MYRELLRQGFRRKTSSTEYLLRVIDELSKSIHDREGLIKKYIEVSRKVLEERPTNAGSINVLRKIGLKLLSSDFDSVKELLDKAREDAGRACQEVARIATHRVSDGDTLMTMSDGICLRSFFKFLADSRTRFSVYVLESRPGMEGVSLAEYLESLGVETYLVVDSAARFFMKNINKVFIGVEAIAVNGAIIGKVGTSVLALAANEARVRVFAIAPIYKFSFETIYGELLRLPEGDWRLLMDEETKNKLPSDYRARVPLFDVTPPNLVDGVITEHGLFAPQAIPLVLRQVYGEFPIYAEPLQEIVHQVEKKYGR